MANSPASPEPPGSPGSTDLRAGACGCQCRRRPRCRRPSRTVVPRHRRDRSDFLPVYPRDHPFVQFMGHGTLVSKNVERYPGLQTCYSRLLTQLVTIRFRTLTHVART